MILELAIPFIILAIVSALLGATGMSGFPRSVAKRLFLTFMILAILAFAF
ncbi:MAG: DUF1328 family protein [Methanomassiliicoccus sp.]|nr:DUF1328 family protein [Methanomassiliicoccus sp.]